MELELEGTSQAIEGFVARLKAQPPRLAVIEALRVESCGALKNYAGFTIRASEKRGENNTLVSPDVGICEDCLRELRDPRDRVLERAGHCGGEGTGGIPPGLQDRSGGHPAQAAPAEASR